MPPHLLILGHGYSGQAVARDALAQGWRVSATERSPSPSCEAYVIAFAEAASALADATHLLVSVPPGADGDPAYLAYAGSIAAAPRLQWIGYLSTTGVYGDRQGAWVDETTPVAPSAERGRRRVAAEGCWSSFAGSRAVELIRLAGIYGPGRSALDEIRACTARPIAAPNHLFGRIHRDDIAGMVMAAAARGGTGLRVLHGNDDEPAASADVLAFAARLLDREPPPTRTLAEAWLTMSDMARSFWSENRRVASRITQQALSRPWRYPSYREGLAAILQGGEQTVEHPL